MDSFVPFELFCVKFRVCMTHESSYEHENWLKIVVWRSSVLPWDSKLKNMENISSHTGRHGARGKKKWREKNCPKNALFPWWQNKLIFPHSLHNQNTTESRNSLPRQWNVVEIRSAFIFFISSFSSLFCASISASFTNILNIPRCEWENNKLW